MNAQIPIVVSYTASDKPPILINGGKAGLCIDIVEALNQIQNQYNFKFVTYPAKRLYLYFDNPNKFDMLIFYNLNWVGKFAPLFAESVPLTYSREVLISLQKKGRTQQFFEQIGKVPTVGVRGFHYAFVDFVLDEDILANKYKMTLVKDELTVIDMIVKQRAEIGLVEDNTLAYYRVSQQLEKNTFLVSNKPDSELDTSFLLRKTSPISSIQMNSYLQQLKDQGLLAKIYAKYGLIPPENP